jgi:hypothetical protein
MAEPAAATLSRVAAENAARIGLAFMAEAKVRSVNVIRAVIGAPPGQRSDQITEHHRELTAFRGLSQVPDTKAIVHLCFP